MDLNGAVAIVTGAGRGIGKEIALSIARAGAKAVVITDISDAIFTVAQQIEAQKAEALPLKCDVSNLEQVENVASKTLEKYGKIDLLVNNAGIYPLKPFLEMTNEDWNKVIDVNLNGVFHYTKAVLPAMVKQKHGKIVNIASIAGAVVAFSSLAHYSASKAAIAGFTKSLAFEVAQYGINVNAVAPGPTDVSEGNPAYQEMYAQVIKTIPLGRIGKPIDIANLVVFLASEEASFITGQCIVCDGGYTLP
ncbi:MAG: 3-oxoacyl-ACP reductase FabG [Candidatus Bathyarchaeota archaeon]|nr:3-oxoacyl-ACP reductase FabG [Candidatus Bathyarchaeota archaeon]